jgi:putative DNA primase/helicase
VHSDDRDTLCDPLTAAEETQILAPLQDLSRRARQQAQPAIGAAIDDPHRLAKVFLAGLHPTFGGAVLRFWQGRWWYWDGTRYSAMSEDALQARIVRATQDEFARAVAGGWTSGANGRKLTTVPKVTGALVRDVILNLKGECEVDSGVQQPAWLGGGHVHPADEYIAAANGLVHLPSLLRPGAAEVLAHTPEYFSPNVLDYAIDTTLGPPREWLAFLDRLWPNDPESIACLREWMNYLITHETKQHKMLALVGPPRSGKGTISKVIERMLGPGNVAWPSLTDLGGEYGLGTLLGKKLAIIPDAHLTCWGDRQRVTERLIAIIGEDPQSINQKYREHVTMKLPVRFMLMANELPHLDNRSGALAARLLVLRLEKSWEGKEDRGLADKLFAELPAILLWAVQGLTDLRQRGSFLQPASGKVYLQQAREAANPFGQFADQCCELGPGRTVACKDLYDAFVTWCADHDLPLPGRPQEFGQLVQASSLGIKPAKQISRHPPIRAYEGIALRAQPPSAQATPPGPRAADEAGAP